MITGYCAVCLHAAASGCRCGHGCSLARILLQHEKRTTRANRARVQGFEDDSRREKRAAMEVTDQILWRIPGMRIAEKPVPAGMSPTQPRCWILFIR